MSTLIPGMIAGMAVRMDVRKVVPKVEVLLSLRFAEKAVMTEMMSVGEKVEKMVKIGSLLRRLLLGIIHSVYL